MATHEGTARSLREPSLGKEAAPLSVSTVGALVSLRSIARIEPNDHRQPKQHPRTTRAQIPSMARGLPRANQSSTRPATPTQAWDMPCPSGPFAFKLHPRARSPPAAAR